MLETMYGHGAIDKPEDFLKPVAYLHREIAGAFQPAIWKEKDSKKEFATYPKRNQQTQSSCVLYSLAKQLAVDELVENGKWRELSPRSLYPYVVAPGGGANSIAAHKLACKQGMTLELLLPTDTLSEDQARKDEGYTTDAKQVAMVYKPGSFIESPSDFETIASILQGYQQLGQKKVVSITLIGSNNGTWQSVMPLPPKNTQPSSLWYHRVVVTDFGLINGKKFLSIDNSWGDAVGNGGQQFLSQDYEPYIYGAIYTLNISDAKVFQEPVVPPKYNWTVDLDTGASGPDVTALQKALQSMGMFPISSVVSPTGYYGGITRASVILFQKAMAIEGTGKVDAATREKLNTVFAI